MSIKCPICGFAATQKYYFMKVNRCCFCGLGFNPIINTVNYKSAKLFNLKDDGSSYSKFAERDFELMGQLVDFNSLNSILEIGPGMGLLADKIREKNKKINYYFVEPNDEHSKNLACAGLVEFAEILDCKNRVDLVIMNHVLEHVEDINDMISSLARIGDRVILFQCNVEGVIPKFLPFLWYGWSLDQHYYHFSLESLKILMAKHGYVFNNVKYYHLDQLPSWSLKGFVKLFLLLLNKFLISGHKKDAFVIDFVKK